jgi:hypothetical protein
LSQKKNQNNQKDGTKILSHHDKADNTSLVIIHARRKETKHQKAYKVQLHIIVLDLGFVVVDMTAYIVL